MNIKKSKQLIFWNGGSSNKKKEARVVLFL